MPFDISSSSQAIQIQNLLQKKAKPLIQFSHLQAGSLSRMFYGVSRFLSSKITCQSARRKKSNL
jgi:hypothetical protein